MQPTSGTTAEVQQGSRWLAWTAAAVVTFLVLNGAIWAFAAWKAQQPGGDSDASALFLVPILGLAAALWGFRDGYHQASWQRVAMRWAAVSGALSIANAVYNEGAWLRGPDPWVFGLSLIIYSPLLMVGAAAGRTVGLDVRDRRDGTPFEAVP